MYFNQSLKRICLTGVHSIWLFSSCINYDYDLSKGINKDITVGSGGISLPVGTTEPVMLSQLIGESDLIVLEDGYYSIRKKGEVTRTKVDISPVSFAPDPFHISPVEVDFSYKSVSEVHVEDFAEQVSLQIPDVNISGQLFERMAMEKKIQGDPLPDGGISFSNALISGSASIDCNFECQIPHEIERIDRIYFGTSEKGQKVTFHIDISSILAIMKPDGFSHQVNTFDLIFPEGFELGIDPADIFASDMQIVANKVSIKNKLLDVSNGKLAVGFYVKAFNHTITERDFHFSDQIRYNLEYAFSGTANDGSVTPLAVIGFDEQLVFHDADIVTAPIEFEYPKSKLVIQGSLYDLEDISRINKVFFHNTSLALTISDPGFPLDLDPQGKVCFELPDRFEYDKTSIPKEFQIEGNKLYVPGNRLLGLYVDLRIRSVDLSDVPIQDNSLFFKESIFTAGGKLTFGKSAVRLSSLSMLKSASLNWVLKGSTLYVEDAEVITQAVETVVETAGDIGIDEKIPNEVKVLHQVFAKTGTEPYVNIHIDMQGNLPESVEWLVLENMQVEFPSFILFDDERVVDHKLMLNGRFNVREGFRMSLRIAGMDFLEYTGGKGLTPVLVGDEKRIRIMEDNQIRIAGKVKCDATSVNMGELKKVQVNPMISLDEITLGLLRGLLAPEISTMNENVVFDMGDELDFLKDGAVMNLHNPQFLLKVGNTMGIPVDVKMDMFAYDKSGKVIDGSRISPVDMTIDAAEINGQETFTHLLISKQPTEKNGYRNIVVPDLSDLLTVLPESVDILMQASANEDAVHEIDLAKESDKYIRGDYEVVIPLRFDAVSLNYVEKIDGLKEAFKKIADNQDELTLEIRTQIFNTIPLNLNLTVCGLDAEGFMIEGVTADECAVSAGDGSDEAVLTDGLLKITIAKGALPGLESLELKIHGDAKETVGGVSLREDQYVQLRNIRLTLLGGININLDNL